MKKFVHFKIVLSIALLLVFTPITVSVNNSQLSIAPAVAEAGFFGGFGAAVGGFFGGIADAIGGLFGGSSSSSSGGDTFSANEVTEVPDPVGDVIGHTTDGRDVHSGRGFGPEVGTVGGDGPGGDGPDSPTNSCAATAGNSCTSAANSCGMINEGTYRCDGTTCNATAPADSLCPDDNFLTITPSPVTRYDDATISWDIDGNDPNTCSLSGQQLPEDLTNFLPTPTGSIVVAATGPLNYTLDCSGITVDKTIRINPDIHET